MRSPCTACIVTLTYTIAYGKPLNELKKNLTLLDLTCPKQSSHIRKSMKQKASGTQHPVLSLDIEKRTNLPAFTRFCVLFLFVTGGLIFLFHWAPKPVFADPMNEQTARLTALLLHMAGLEPVVSGPIISARGFSVKIIAECTAIFVGILFFSFVIAFPTTRRNKAAGLLFGLSFLFGANLIRLFFIILIGIKYRAAFDYAHVYIGQIGMILFVLLTVLVWLRSLAATQMKDTPYLFFIRFVAYSSVLFILWLYVDQSFVLANFYLVKWLLAFFDLSIHIPEKIKLYPHTFNTFHMIAFISLTLATETIRWQEKAKNLAIGLLILCCVYFLFRFHYALFINFHIKYAKSPFIALIILNEWLIPFALWLYFVRNELFTKKSVVCPICGIEKVGLADHIRAKHGEHMLAKWPELIESGSDSTPAL
jgi:exosortase H (IPTLxxWG-CTERM-specific)